MITLATIAHGAEIKVLSSTSMSTVMPEVIPQFERASGNKVSVSYNSSNMILDRLKKGEAADIVILTGPVIDELTKQGKVVPGSRVDIASTGLGVAIRAGAPKPDISSTDAFKRTLLNAESVAYTATGASGVYFAGLIERLGITELMKTKSRVISSGLVGNIVAKGEAELGVQMISEIMAVPEVDLVGPLPRELQSISLVSAGILADAKQPEAARALIKFLSTSTLAPIFKAKGLEPLASGQSPAIAWGTVQK